MLVSLNISVNGPRVPQALGRFREPRVKPRSGLPQARGQRIPAACRASGLVRQTRYASPGEEPLEWKEPTWPGLEPGGGTDGLEHWTQLGRTAGLAKGRSGGRSPAPRTGSWGPPPPRTHRGPGGGRAPAGARCGASTPPGGAPAPAASAPPAAPRASAAGAPGGPGAPRGSGVWPPRRSAAAAPAPAPGCSGGPAGGDEAWAWEAGGSGTLGTQGTAPAGCSGSCPKPPSWGRGWSDGRCPRAQLSAEKAGPPQPARRAKQGGDQVRHFPS